jgi:hypothetical protein
MNFGIKKKKKKPKTTQPAHLGAHAPNPSTSTARTLPSQSSRRLYSSLSPNLSLPLFSLSSPSSLCSFSHARAHRRSCQPLPAREPRRPSTPPRRACPAAQAREPRRACDPWPSRPISAATPMRGAASPRVPCAPCRNARVQPAATRSPARIRADCPAVRFVFVN